MNEQVIYERAWLLLLIIIPVLYFLYRRILRRYQPSLTVSALRYRASKKVSPDMIILSLRLLTILFIIAALVNFRLIKNVKHQKTSEEADIILALDISKSMQTEDIKPTRLEALKDVLNRFIAGRTNDKFGIVLYAGESVYWCPLTKDYAFLASRLRDMYNKALNDGTAIGLGLVSAVNALQKSKSNNKLVILLTDGENNTGFIDPITAARIAGKFNVKVYTIGIGKNGPSTILLTDLNGNTVRQTVQAELDEKTLKQIAGATGGSYFNANDNNSLQKIYATINKIEQPKIVEVTDIKYYPIYRVFAFAAIFILLLELTLKFTFLRTWPE